MIILCAVLLSLCGADAWKKNSRPLGQIEQVPISPEVNMTTVNSFKFSYCNFFTSFCLKLEFIYLKNNSSL